MEKIIKKFLKYETDATKEQRDEMVANLVALALGMLDSTGKYNLPDDCAKVAYRNFSIVSGETDENLEIHYRRKVLQDSSDLYDDVMIIGHEVCHVAQNYLKDNPEYNMIDIYYSEDGKFTPFLKKIIEVCYPEHMEMLNKKGIIRVVRSFQEIEDLYDYLESFYYLQGIELEAYNFQTEFLKNIFKMADNMDLDLVEKIKLKYYKTKSKPYIEMVEEIMEKSERARRSNEITTKIKNCSKQIVEDVLKRYPDFFKDLESAKRDKLEEMYDDIYNVISALEINYNNNIAQQLFNSLAKSKLEYHSKFELINQLYGYTPIQLDDNQTNYFKDLMCKYNKNRKVKVKYDVLTEDRKRIASENEKFSPSVM